MRKDLKNKTAIFCHSVPPSVTGTAVRIERLCRDLDPDSYCIITSRDVEGENAEQGRLRLPCDYHRLPSEWRRLKAPASDRLKPVFAWLNVWLKAFQRGRNLARVLVKEKCSAIVVFSGDLEDMPAAWWAARKTGCALIPVFDDDYIYQWTDPVKRHCARLFEPRVVRAASGVFSISEFSRDEYQRRYGVSSAVLHSLTPGPVGTPPGQVQVRHAPESLKVLFAGSVYHANFDAISSLMDGLKMLRGCPAQLHIYTPQAPEVLSRQGIEGPLVVHPSVGPNQIGAIQADSDILFLPMGLRTNIPEVLRTSCPTKLADYLVSGRPILAYAPPDSFLAWYVRENGCGLLVDRVEPQAMAAAIERLYQDADLRLQLVQRAFACAAKTFDCRVNQKVFTDRLNEWSQAPGRAS